MTISTYITTRNALFWQSTLEQTIRQSLLFSDEIIISVSKYTTDGTYNLLNSLKNNNSNNSKIKVYTDTDLTQFIPNGDHLLAKRKTFALKKCTGDYCILQDDDECIHEKYAEYIKLLPKTFPDTLAFRFNVIHFYRSYDRYQNGPNWYKKKIYMVKNIPEIIHGKVESDPDNHIILEKEKYIPLDSLSSPKIIDTNIMVHHYGWCRNDAILLMKKYFQEIRWWGKDYWKTHEFPFKFDDPSILPEFKDNHPKFMIPIIENQRKFNSIHIKDFDK